MIIDSIPIAITESMFFGANFWQLETAGVSQRAEVMHSALRCVKEAYERQYRIVLSTSLYATLLRIIWVNCFASTRQHEFTFTLG